ncbi:MAG: hypothetical protein JW772_04095 [Candidatus Diapherotrites archaeon]|nr:hypothetical protein [Candidatus Diapherotrites archaeon]
MPNPKRQNRKPRQVPRKTKEIFRHVRGVSPRKRKSLAEKRNLTLRMLDSLWKASEGSSDLEPLAAKDRAMLNGIRERLVVQQGTFTMADHTNVSRVYKRVFGPKAKPD